MEEPQREEDVCPKGNSVKAIALLGVTGTGKSTFISHCTNEQVLIRTSLRSCTQEIQAFKCKFQDFENVCLVDTPGFNDTSKPDMDVLAQIADWLEGIYSNGFELSGIIYLHSITDDRMTGSAKDYLVMFRKLCGSDYMKKVILATTMWDKVDQNEGLMREQELRDTPDFWGYMLRHGSTMHRYHNDAASAKKLIEILTYSSPDNRPQVAREIYEDGKTLPDVEAAGGWKEALGVERDRNIRELDTFRAIMKERLAGQDARFEKKFEELEQMKEELSKVVAEKDGLVRAIENLNMKHSEEMAEMKRSLEKGQVDKRRFINCLTETAKGLGLRVRSDPGENKVEGEVSLTIHSNWFAFTGPQYSVAHLNVDLFGKDLREKPHHWDASQQKMPHFICDFWASGFLFIHHEIVEGEAEAANETDGRRCGHRTNCFVFGPNRHTYRTILSETFDCITHLSLGDHGVFWINTTTKPRLPQGQVENHTIQNWPQDSAEEDTEMVHRVWWGKSNSHVIERKDGSRTWNLKGLYAGLGHYIRYGIRGCNKIKALAMDKDSGVAWVIVFMNGEVAYSRKGERTDHFDHFEFEEFATKNFGCDFGFMEESKKEDTVRSSGPLDEPIEGPNSST